MDELLVGLYNRLETLDARLGEIESKMGGEITDLKTERGSVLDFIYKLEIENLDNYYMAHRTPISVLNHIVKGKGKKKYVGLADGSILGYKIMCCDRNAHIIEVQGNDAIDYDAVCNTCSTIISLKKE